MACCLICLAIVEEGFGAFCMGVAIFEVQEPAIRKPDKAQQRVKIGKLPENLVRRRVEQAVPMLLLMIQEGGKSQ